MQKILIAAAAGGLLLFGSLTFIAVSPSNVSAAEGDTDTTVESTDTWHEDMLDRLVEEGVISREMADDIEDTLPENGFRFGGRGIGPLTEDFDPDEMLERFRHRFENFELPEDYDPDEMLERFRHRFENFELPEDYDPDEMLERFRHRFENFEMPENFDLESFMGRGFPGRGFGFFGNNSLSDAFDDLTPEALRDAIENGTLGGLIDFDALLEGATQEINQVVTDGSITREQADRMIRSLTDRLEAMENGELDFGGHRGSGRGFEKFEP
jgi:hypothetical protein